MEKNLTYNERLKNIKDLYGTDFWLAHNFSNDENINKIAERFSNLNYSLKGRELDDYILAISKYSFIAGYNYYKDVIDFNFIIKPEELDLISKFMGVDINNIKINSDFLFLVWRTVQQHAAYKNYLGYVVYPGEIYYDHILLYIPDTTEGYDYKYDCYFADPLFNISVSISNGNILDGLYKIIIKYLNFICNGK